jgi:tetratricopeptide (TPR) repeat protein
VSPEENIPLQEAVSRGLIPCSACGGQGADVRKIGDRNHFLCARCLGRGRAWTAALTALAILIVGLGGFLLLRARAPSGGPDAPPDSKAPPEHVTQEIVALLDTKQYGHARARIQELMGPFPKRPDLNLLLGKCLMGLKAWDAAVAPLRLAFDAGPPTDEQAALFLGLALKSLGRSAEALKYLELPTTFNKEMPLARAEAYLDLERYDDALKLLPDTAETLWARHRAILYLGKGDDARKLVDGGDPFLLAGQLREEGDFAAAAKILEAHPGPRARKAELILAIESGDLAKVDAVAAELASDDAPYFRAIAHLLGGRREKAQTGAWEFLAKCDKEYAPLRLERMMMSHLVGELKTADLEAEIKLLSRFHANDLLWYLALATGDRAWAEKAAASTPGHNYPYHSIQRLLKK